MKKNTLIFYLIGMLGFACSPSTTTTKEQSTTGSGQVAATTAISQYSNPVMPGDYADPSAVRVGDDYWATATSSEWAPLFPIMHSKNMVDWETVGHVFPDKLPDWAEAHFWAPEIAHEKGKYYIYYTAKKKGGNLCVGAASASSPTGPYTDHGPLVCQEVGSIDGFEIRDENGDLYLIWKEDGNSRGLPTPLWGQRMNEERTALLGEKFELFRNDPKTWEGGLVEGPAIIKRGDYFYLFYAGDACCGRACTYGVGVARAKSLRGPWEKHPNNPIMQKNDEWRCPGHGTVLTTQDGRDYLLYHAYSAESTVYPGRQGLLDEIKWGENNWPYFENKSPGVSGQVPYGQESAGKDLNVTEEFNKAALSKSWQWPVTQQPSFTIDSANAGQLIVQATPEKIGTVLGQRTKTADYTATTTVYKNSLQRGTMASLTAIGDPENAVGIALSNNEIVLWFVRENKLNTLARVAAPKENKVQLRLITQNGDKMQFAWSTDGNQWNTLNKDQAIDASYLPPWDRGVRVGLTVKGPKGAKAAFEDFQLLNTQAK